MRPDEDAHKAARQKSSRMSVALRILQAVPDLQTLSNALLVSRTFYAAYTNNALDLIRDVVWRMSPPLWELREMGIPWAEPETTQYLQCLTFRDQTTPTMTSKDYVSHYDFEICVVARVIGAVFTDEQRDYLRSDRVALAAVHDAMVRIWTFCRIFGCGKGRATDLEGQTDWLAGGLLAHRRPGSFVFGWSEAVALAPESFGKGNRDGLTMQQTRLMLSMWHSLRRTLRQKIQRVYTGRASEEWEANALGMLAHLTQPAE